MYIQWTTAATGVHLHIIICVHISGRLGYCAVYMRGERAGWNHFPIIIMFPKSACIFFYILILIIIIIPQNGRTPDTRIYSTRGVLQFVSRVVEKNQIHTPRGYLHYPELVNTLLYNNSFFLFFSLLFIYIQYETFFLLLFSLVAYTLETLQIDMYSR